MNIYEIVSEAAGYASTGGLADVAGDLPAALAAQGAQVLRVLPFYRAAWDSGHQFEDTGLRLKVPLGFESLSAEIWRASDDPVPTYLIRRDEYFDRTHLYSMAHRDYEDNFERFVFFQKAAVQLLEALGFAADIVHVHDWQTALVPLFLRYGIGARTRAPIGPERAVLTIHNLAYQGIFPAERFPSTNLPFQCFSIENLEYYGKLNCLKGGILHAARVTTVSPSYAEEIQTAEQGCGLEGVLASVSNRLVGILNGVNYDRWDPRHDQKIARPYSAEQFEGKAVCKRALCRKLELRCTPRTPLLGMVSRLAEQKGLNLLAEAMEALMAHDVCLVILGEGQEAYHRLCRDWAARWPGRVAVEIGYNAAQAHEIEAAADLFLMPSRFEPCGLNQIYSLRYGTVPVVHATGGLKDTVRDLNAEGTVGTGLVFKPYEPEALVAAIERGLTLYRDRAGWTALCQRIMAEDFSWTRSAQAYLDVFRKLA